MLNKRVLIFIKNQIKNISYFWIVAVIGAYGIVLPLAIASFNKYGVSVQNEETVIRYTQFFLPVIASVILLPVLNSYINSKGNEVLFFYHRIIVKDVILITLIYSLLILPIYIVLSLAMGINAAEFIRIIICIFLFSSTAYFLCFLLKSVSLGYFLVFIYYFLSISIISNSPAAFFNPRGFTLNLFLSQYVYLLIITVLFFIIGTVINNKYINYK